MSKSIKKMLVFLFILITVSTLCVTVKAATIKETTNTNDKYDTITSGTIIIGVSKFTPDQTVTGIKAATAGANDRLVYTLKNGNDTNYSYPKMYYYLNTSWYEYDAEGNLKYLKDGIESLDIYYVNNKLKQGINLPTKPVEKAEYKVFFVDGTQQVSNKTIVEGEKLGELPTLTKPHYIVSWVDSKGNTVNADTVITEDTVFFAKWTEATKVELTLNMNGKSSTQTYYVGDEVKTTPEKTGYEFLGWYTADGKKYDKTFTMPETNLTLTAKWNKTVTNVDELEKGIANATETTVITLANDITGINKTLTVNKKITLEGNGKALKFAEIPKTKDVASALVISSNDTVINNLTVEMTQIDGWQSNYAIQVYNAKGVVLNNVAANNGDGGIIVNASEVELKGTTKLNNNEFGGIEVSKGKADGLPNSKLTVTGTIEMNNEESTVPVVWVERNADDSCQGKVIGLDKYTQKVIKENGKNQVFFYSDAKYETTQRVSDSNELSEALAKGNNVVLTDNVSINKTINVSKGSKVVFDTNNYNITSGVTRSTANDLFIIDGGILEITGNGKMTATDNIAEVRNGGKLIVKSGNFESKAGITFYSGSATNPPMLGGEIIIEGGTFKGQEGCVGVANGGKLTIKGGEFTAIDNAIIAGNGTKAATGEMKDTEINITNGTFNGGITSSGYIAMGIYHPQTGTLNVTGGTFNITKGSGIIMRSGTLNLSGAKFNYKNEDDTFKGWAGDKKSQIPVGKDVVKCTHPEPAGYAYNVVLNNVADTYTVLEFAE